MSNTYKSKYYMSEVEAILDSVKSKADKEYVDEQITETETVVKNYADTKTTAALDGAKTYTDEKIASSEIGKLADGAVTTAKIADGAVTADKIADGVIPTKVSELENDSGYLPSANAVGKKGTGEGAEIFNLYENTKEFTANIATGEYSHTEGVENAVNTKASHGEGMMTRTGAYGIKILSYKAGTTTGTGTYVLDVSTCPSYIMWDMIRPWDFFNKIAIRPTASGGDSNGGGVYYIKTSDFDMNTNTLTITEGFQKVADNAYILTDKDISTYLIPSTIDRFGLHVEGYWTEASGNFAHAEGKESQAYGYASHAEGDGSEANGAITHAEGHGTIAWGDSQHVQGKYNIEDGNGKYTHIVGNGSSNTTRSNAHTIDWNGVGWFAGGLKVGGSGQYDSAAKDIATIEQVTAKANETESAAKSYADTKVAATLAAAEEYSEAKATEAEENAKEYADSIKPTKVSELENDSGYLNEHQSLAGYATKKYADNAAAGAETSAKSYTDTKTAAALDGAKSYTDEKIASSEIGKLADGAVTTAKIADNAVSEIKLDNSLKSKINGKADGFAINTSVTNNTLLLSDKTETYLVENAVANLTLTMPENMGIGYRCAFGFKSGQTATDITFPQYEISWSGADCNSSKQFLPMPNTIYVVGVKCIGIGSDGKPIIYARVGVC